MQIKKLIGHGNKFILFIGLFIIMYSQQSYCAEVSYNDEIIGYNLGILETNRFLNNINLETLQNMHGNVTIYKLKLENGQISCIINGFQYTAEDFANSTFFQYNTSFDLDSFTENFFKIISKNNLSNILKENGINENIENRYIINLNPISIYIITDKNQYIVENIGEMYMPLENVFKLYTTDEYISFYKIKKGELIYNGNIMSDHVPLFFDGNIYIPIRTAIKFLGCDEVLWDESTQTASFCIGNNLSYIKVLDNNMLLVNTPKEETYLGYFMWNNQIYINFYDKRFYSNWLSNGFSVSVDYANKTIVFNL